MIRKQGIGVSAGLVQGPAYIYLHRPVLAEKRKIEEGQVAQERARFLDALSKAKDAILRQEGDRTSRSIMDTHVMMLEDPSFRSQVEQEIKDNLLCASWAVETVGERMVGLLSASTDDSLLERVDDFHDIEFRLIRILQGEAGNGKGSLPNPVVLVADRLLPSEVFNLDKGSILAIALDTGGPTSHVAILARSLQIPTVMGLGNLSALAKDGDTVVLDGGSGQVVVDPDQMVRDHLQARQEAMRKERAKLEELAHEPTRMKDGRVVHIFSNIELVDELAYARSVGAEGVGLYRSEYLLINNGEGVSEDFQFSEYRRVVEGMAPLPVTIRTFDVGGDKVVPGLGIDEQNPILGWRAVRFCLSRKDIFLTQLRALLRASAFGKLRIMFPMIGGVGELDSVLEVLDEARRQLDERGVAYDKQVQVGTMIEVPSAALCADLLAKRVDFFSIGTNDLIQYTLAVDRGNEKIAYLYQPYHPAVLRSIKMIIEAAHQAKIPCGMCGEMAGDVRCTALLAGMGLDEFSMGAQSVLPVRRMLRSVAWKDTRKLRDQVMTLESADKIKKALDEWNRSHR